MTFAASRRSRSAHPSLGARLVAEARYLVGAGLVISAVCSFYALAAAPPGDESANGKGVYGAPVQWPIIAIHAVLLPDGRVMTYGTDQKGQQGAQFIYDVWNPAEGFTLAAHMVLPNTTGTDIFCAAQSVISASGEVFIAGGDETVNRVRNYSNDKSTIFSPAANDIRPAGGMAFPRWYPSAVSMASGDIVILGGRISKPKTCAAEDLSCAIEPAATPEVFNQDSGWRTLAGATDRAMSAKNWYYPRAYLAPNGKVLALMFTGQTYSLGTAGDGAWALQPLRLVGANPTYPSAMYAPGKILTLRYKSWVYSVDVNAAKPSATRVADFPAPPAEIAWSNMTVLADGKVLVNGGYGKWATTKRLEDAAYTAQLWDPATRQWSEGARAIKTRIYHSTALLLPDATVLTAGGGAPGPVKNLNAEIYYPAYLYAADGSGQPAERPTIADAPATANVGASFTASVAEGTEVSRVTLVRSGSVTHSYNSDQRFLEAQFTQTGNSLDIAVPASPNVALPGFYMMFVFDGAGVPSVAKIVKVIG